MDAQDRDWHLPQHGPERASSFARQAGEHNSRVRALAGLWDELRAFLGSDAHTSGRLALRYDGENGGPVLERRSLKTICSSWQAPALLLDAILPTQELLEPVLGHPVEIKADIAAHVWTPLRCKKNF